MTNDVQDFTTQEETLRAQLAELNAQKQAAVEREKQEQLDAIARYEDEATAYRNQAAKATTDDDKRKLYQYADDCEQMAAELRVQLGIVTPEQLRESVSEKETAIRNATARKINALFFKALAALLVYMFADLASSKVDMPGFFSASLKGFSEIAYTISGVFGGCWLMLTVLSAYVGTYTAKELGSDFKNTTPAVRLGVLAVLAFAILNLLTAFLSHAD